MLWIAQDHRIPERDVGAVVQLDPTPLHGASVNDAPPCVATLVPPPLATLVPPQS